MKTRTGFVSNSSSSSFVIAKAYMTEEQVNALRAGLKQIHVEGYDPEERSNQYEEWGENGRSWEETSHYFCIETYYVGDLVDDLFTKLNLQDVPDYHIEG